MPGYTRIGGTWRRLAPHARISGVWSRAKEGYVRDAGVWKQWWLDGGVSDRTFNTVDSITHFTSTTDVRHFARQSDGKIVVVGSFTLYNNVAANRIARLNADGTLDTQFSANIGTGFNNTVFKVAIQPDGKIVVAGAFISFQGTTGNRILRLNSDGTLDTAFATNMGTGFNNQIEAMAIQPDGKIVVGGNFENYNGTSSVRIARLNSDGTLDTAFASNLGTGLGTGGVFGIALQSDGRIVIGGGFTTFNGVTVNRIVRLTPSGARDESFTMATGTGFNNSVIDLAVQSDNRIIVVGSFTSLNGTTRNRLVRLNSDGNVDTGFSSLNGTGPNNTVNAIAIQSDGGIVIGGTQTSFNGTTTTRITRIASNGELDTSFAANTAVAANSSVRAVTIQADGRILIGGIFTTYANAPYNGIARLNTNGTRDTSFPIINGANFVVETMAIQSDGKIVIGGTFTSFNGVNATRIARLNSDGSVDTTFVTNTGTGFDNGVFAIAIQSDGKIVVGGLFTTFNGTTATRLTRLNANGTLDTTFNTNLGTGLNSNPNGIAIQSDGRIVLTGAFTTVNGATVNRIARLNSDGTRDTSYATGTGFPAQANGIVLQADGKAIIVGTFTTYNSAPNVNRIVRLNTDGTRDTSFVPNLNNDATAVALQPDGKVIVGGNFTFANSALINRIMRLNADGTSDTAFNSNTGTGLNNIPEAIVVQLDGQIVVGGTFTSINGITANRITRLNTDGTRDLVFHSNVGNGTAANNTVNWLAVESSGRVLMSGNFDLYNNITRRRIARIGDG